MLIQHNISLLPHNTFGIEANARTFVAYDNEEELSSLIRDTCQLPQPLLHIGQGSNLLFMNDFKGTILLNTNTEINVVHEDGETILVEVGAGRVMDEFIDYAISNKWYGLENLSNIPGQVGASAVQNIGAYGVEAGDFIHSVRCISLLDGTSRLFTHDECKFAYRHSIFKTESTRGKYAVTSVVYQLSKTFVPHLDYGGIRQYLSNHSAEIGNLTPQHLRHTIIKIRESKLPDPKLQGNAGSFFMNPVVERNYFADNIQSLYPHAPFYEVGPTSVKIPAAWLIEQCGWKGRSLGRAGVHTNQPLVLVNLGNAKGEDVKTLSEAIQKDVSAKFGIDIHPEVNFIY